MMPARSLRTPFFTSRSTLDGHVNRNRNPAILASNSSSSSPSNSSVNRRPLLKLLGGGLICSGVTLQGRSVAAAASTIDPYAAVLEDPQWPAEFPFRGEAFQRYDETPDSDFYSYPRFVTHIDDAAIASLTDFYASSFPSPSPSTALLDICSSWISHYPKNYTAGRITGLGMNEEELAKNPILNDYVVKDLNADPILPFEDNTFDVVTNAVSVDYLTQPLAVHKEIRRVLKPGGLAINSFSNRCFPTKAISLWTSTGDLDHIWIVGSYFHYADGFQPPQAKDITRPAGLLRQKGDPMYVVYARKQS